MGIGTTPSALITHGIDTTVVEIDPVVYEFAAKHFNLPPRHTPVLEDAVVYARKLANSSSEQFDYIINDVFTGGAEPIELFTIEFLKDLHTLLAPKGVIAIVSSPSIWFRYTIGSVMSHIFCSRTTPATPACLRQR